MKDENGIVPRLEKLLGRTLGQEERERILRIRDILGIADNDALWDILAAMEYHRSYYEDLPERIRAATARIQVAAPPSAPGAPGQAWLPWGAVILFLLMIYGSAAMWAGHTIGAAQDPSPLLILRMPSGAILGAMALASGLFLGIRAARSFASDSGGRWKRELPAAAGCALAGAILLGLAVA